MKNGALKSLQTSVSNAQSDGKVRGVFGSGTLWVVAYVNGKCVVWGLTGVQAGHGLCPWQVCGRDFTHMEIGLWDVHDCPQTQNFHGFGMIWS